MGNKTFKIGEIALFQNLPIPFNLFNGDECEIVGALQLCLVEDIFGKHGLEYVYRVLHRGYTVAVKQESLKKKPGNLETEDSDFGKTVGWKDCAWCPDSVEV